MFWFKRFWRWLWGIPSPLHEMPPGAFDFGRRSSMLFADYASGRKPLSSMEEGIRAELIKARFYSKLGETTRLCQWCMEFYKEDHPRSSTELELLHQRILQASPNIRDDAAICDPCYGKVIESVVRIDPYTSQLEPGISNHGYPNIALRRSLN